jgi:HEAT repeat protein
MDGREQEGRDALEACIEMLKGKGDAIYSSVALRRVKSLAINSRLANDSVFLLGELKAGEAVPLLVRILENDRQSFLHTGLEMDALVKIGTPAIPALIHSFRKAEITATAETELVFGFEIDPGETAVADNALVDDEDGSIEPDPEFEDQVKLYTRIIKRNLLWVLGEIGDDQALPFLASLLTTDADHNLAEEVQRAIRRIKGEPESEENSDSESRQRVRPPRLSPRNRR